MAETLGSLCDKLTIVKLKQWHQLDPERLHSLNEQEKQLIAEVDAFVATAAHGGVPPERLTFSANKVFKPEGNTVAQAEGDIGQIFAQLAHVNCALWHEQEKVYEFETVPSDQKNHVVKKLALLNLERNECIDGIDKAFCAMIEMANADMNAMT